MSYDDTKYRYKRIRDQMVEMLKDVTLFSKEQTQDIINQIKSLDNIVGERGKYKNIVTAFMDFLTPSSRDKAASINMQRLLESLSANDLFIRAASLRTSL